MRANETEDPLNRHLNLLFTAIGNIIRNKVRSIVLILCLIAVLFPFVSAISISEGIKFQSLISVEEGADIYVTGDLFGSNAPISLDYLGGFTKDGGGNKGLSSDCWKNLFRQSFGDPFGTLPENLPKSIRLAQGRIFREKGDVIVGEGLAKEFRLQPGVRFSL